MIRTRRSSRALPVAVLSAAVLAAPFAVTFATTNARAAEIRADRSAATVFMYHRFGETQYPSTNVTLEQLDAHIAELKHGRYHVLPLQKIIDAFRSGTSLPDRTVAITVDDAYRTVYTAAWPRLRAAGLPVTVFVATEPVDAGNADMMTWEQIRELRAEGVTFGHHTVSHLHMPDATPIRNRDEIARAMSRFETELGERPRLFAYPYGETSAAVRALVVESGFDAAFGQHSGVAHAGADRFYLPRFPLNESFGSVERLRLAANALPLPVSDVLPADPMLGPNPPNFGFTVAPEVGALAALNCFPSPAAGAAKLERLGDRRIEVRVGSPFLPGRARFNCTLPAGEGRWRWFGMQFYIPGG
jgi:peptidoglycan/xylan/chitin deacetylase (PgdA/CDA1 family)